MTNMITRENEKLVLNSIGNLFTDSEYSIELSVCGDVFCNCGASVINIIREENQKEIGFQVPIDVHEKLIRERNHKDYYIKNTKDEYLIDLLKNSLTEIDWVQLKEKYYKNKFILSEQINPKDIDYDFGKEYGKLDGMMFPYRIAIACSEFRLRIADKNYVVIDDYCKTPNCDCNNVYLTIIMLSEDENKTIDVGNFLYNYKTGNKSELKEANKGEVNSIISELKKRIPTLDKTIERRHSVIKVLFQKFLLNNDSIKQDTFSKIGRNQLCPCGSGKKYKQCHGK